MQKVLVNTKAGTEALCVLRLVLELCSHDLGDVLDTSPDCLLCLCGGSLHHRLQGGVGVLDPKIHQHVLRHLLR
jgi:hypothetical protein